MKKDTKKLLKKIFDIILDKKGVNPVVMDIRGLSNITDYQIIAEGTVDRHVKAIASAIIEELKKDGINPYKVEGRERGDWIVIDYTGVTVHLFMPVLREKYKLEKLWPSGKVIGL